MMEHDHAFGLKTAGDANLLALNGVQQNFKCLVEWQRFKSFRKEMEVFVQVHLVHLVRMAARSDSFRCIGHFFRPKNKKPTDRSSGGGLVKSLLLRLLNFLGYPPAGRHMCASCTTSTDAHKVRGMDTNPHG